MTRAHDARLALEIAVRGPEFTAALVLQAGGPGALVGRDADCHLCLPDPHRNVSRRHLALCNEGGQLHFRVLSAVNGVGIEGGEEVRPGGTGILRPGQVLRLADYELLVHALPGTDGADDDPWSQLEHQAAALEPAGAATQDDPFGDWFARSTFGPGMPDSPAPDAAGLAPAQGVEPFLRGLGLDPDAIGALTEAEAHEAGTLARMLVEGVLALRPRLPADNPLAAPASHEAAVRYLFAGRAASAGRMPPQQALRALFAALQERVRTRGADDGGA